MQNGWLIIPGEFSFFKPSLGGAALKLCLGKLECARGRMHPALASLMRELDALHSTPVAPPTQPPPSWPGASPSSTHLRLGVLFTQIKTLRLRDLQGPASCLG